MNKATAGSGRVQKAVASRAPLGRSSRLGGAADAGGAGSCGRPAGRPERQEQSGNHIARLPWFVFLCFVPVILASGTGKMNKEVEQCVALSLSSLSGYMLLY
ncbi:hypothetical protein VPH35_014537 [Triticum aestivum]